MATLEWQAAAQAYHAHHFHCHTCHTCIAAGRGPRYGQRCDIGAGLWTAYNEPTALEIQQPNPQEEIQ